MLPLLALLVEPYFARIRKRRKNAVNKSLSRMRFFSSALDARLDFSSVHHFPGWIEDATNRVLRLDPSNCDAIKSKQRMPEFLARATEIRAMRHADLAIDVRKH
jgi:hypothetical protein